MTLRWDTRSRVSTYTKYWTYDGSQSVPVEYLVVAGGGGGGSTRTGGGGGAGGYRSSVSGESSGRGASAESVLLLTPGSYTVTVGAGGAASVSGSDSVFGSITSLGGGFGGDSTVFQTTLGRGANGGSGGGSRSNEAVPSPATGATGQGFDGGASATLVGQLKGTGGGGAGANGAGYATDTGVGGVGVASSITGTSTFRAGGGGGGNSSAGNPLGGNGGGGGAFALGGNVDLIQI